MVLQLIKKVKALTAAVRDGDLAKVVKLAGEIIADAGQVIGLAPEKAQKAFQKPEMGDRLGEAVRELERACEPGTGPTATPADDTARLPSPETISRLVSIVTELLKFIRDRG